MRLLRLALPALVAVAALPSSAAAETEPNDLLTQAELVSAAPYTSTGTFGTENDLDYWKVYVGTPGTQINATVEASASDVSKCNYGCGLLVAVGNVDSYGNFSVLNRDSDYRQAAAADPNIKAVASYSTPGTGTYYVRVERSGDRPPGYSLSIDANQPLVTYQPESCDAARAEYAKRSTDLVKANQVRDDAAAKLTAASAALTRATKKRVAVSKKLKKAKRKLKSRRTARRKARVVRLKARYSSRKLAEQRAAAAVTPANSAFATAQAAVPFQQGRVAEQDSATRATCGGSL